MFICEWKVKSDHRLTLYIKTDFGKMKVPNEKGKNLIFKGHTIHFPCVLYRVPHIKKSEDKSYKLTLSTIRVPLIEFK